MCQWDKFHIALCTSKYTYYMCVCAKEISPGGCRLSSSFTSVMKTIIKTREKKNKTEYTMENVLSAKM